MASRKSLELTPRQQAWLLPLLPVLLAIVVYYEYVLPIRQQNASLEIQYQTLQAQNLRGKMLLANQADLLRRIANAHQELEQLHQIVPDRPADDDFVKTLYGAAASSAVHIRSLVGEAFKNQQYFTAMPFQLRADGTYYRILSFFMRLANSSRIVDVSDLSLERPGVSGGGTGGAYTLGPEETVAADCLVTTYYSGSQPAAPATKGQKRR
jgi:Tfp pilus assembly protein PilO